MRYYEREPLILYSGGELTGRTRLKAPPPGLGRGNSKSSEHSAEASGRRSSEGAEARLDPRPRGSKELHRTTTALRTLSSGHVEIPFNALFSSSGRMAVSAPNIEHSSELPLSCVFLEGKDETPPEIPPKLNSVVKDSGNLGSESQISLKMEEVNPPLPRRPLSTLPIVKTRSGLSVAKSLHDLTA